MDIQQHQALYCHAAQLSLYHTWLGQLFTALEAEDRQTALMGLQAARAGLQAVAQ